MAISVIIPTYMRKDVLRLTLLSLYKQTYNQHYEVIVVDDGSIDGTGSMVQEMAKTSPMPITYIFKERGRDREAPKARNIGAKKAKYDKLVFLDQDEIASPRLLQKLSQAQGNDPYVFTVGQNLLLPIEALKEINDQVVLDGHSYQDTGVFARLRGINGMSLTSTISNIGCVSAKKFWEVGGFDESFIGYGYHDADLMNRLRSIGMIKIKVTDANAFHIAHRAGTVHAKAKHMYSQKEHDGRYLNNKLYMTIVLPVRNQLQYFNYCFDTLVKTFHRDQVKLIIIDDCSDDETKIALQKLSVSDNFKDFIILKRNNTVQGLTKNWNDAVKMALPSNYYLFLNSDIIFSNFAIYEMIKVLNNDERVGVVGPTTSYASTKQRIMDFYPTRYDVLEKPDIFAAVNALADKVRHIYRSAAQEELLDGVSGFCFLVRGEVFTKHKIFFDESFEGPANEVDFQREIKKAGYRSDWARLAYVHHFGKRTYYTEMGQDKANLLWAKAGLQLSKKWLGDKQNTKDKD